MSFQAFMDLLRDGDCVAATRRPPNLRVNEPQNVNHSNAEKSLVEKKLGTEYVQELQDEDDEYDEYNRNVAVNNEFQDLESLTVLGSLCDSKTANNHLYENYSFDKSTKNNLIINEYKPLILESISQYPVIIIKGQTGCGKTTQVPMFILEDCRNKNTYCNIVVTQPRRIAAVSVAKRVCQESNWKLGTLVGYQIGLDKSSSEDTRLLYCTTGILLEQLRSAKDFSSYTHIIVDEVHDRDCDTDFLLTLIKKFLRTEQSTKIILMSATMNTHKFSEYFSQTLNEIEVPVIELRDERKHELSNYYIDSISNLFPIHVPVNAFDKPQICPEIYKIAAQLVSFLYIVDYRDNPRSRLSGSVLIFLPGINEIDTMYKALEKIKESYGDEKWTIYPLHSSITFEEQTKVFEPSEIGTRKIILSTNIAESSITVPDIKYVIDFCLTKIQIRDPDMSYSSLQMSWISKSQGTQREGRAGRVMSGRVYRLVPEDLYITFSEESTPEMLRCPLETLFLKCKKLKLGSPLSILGRAMDPPDLSNIQRTVLDLKKVGALILTSGGVYKKNDGDLTLIGNIMASLPLEISHSKLIILGNMFGVLEESIIMACAMSTKSVFCTPYENRLEAYSSKLSWDNGVYSDPIAYLNVYKLWKHKFKRSFTRSGAMSENDWCKQHYVQLRSIKEVDQLVTEVQMRLRKFNICVPQNEFSEDFRQTDDKKPILLKIILAGAAYPNYFSIKQTFKDKDAVKILGGRDPSNTVYLTNFPSDQPRPLYSQSIKKQFKHCGSGIQVSFDGSCKVYLKFESSLRNSDRHTQISDTSSVTTAICRAVKMRLLKIPIIVPILPVKKANVRAKAIFGNTLDKNGLYTVNKYQQIINLSVLPGPKISLLHVAITHIQNPHAFWVHITTDNFEKKHMWILKKMRDRRLFAPICRNDLNNGIEGKICVAPFLEDGLTNYCRVKVICNFRSNQSAKVLFIDYGNSANVEVDQLLDFTAEGYELGLTTEPGLAIKCSLAEIEPSLEKNPNGVWSQSSTLAFCKHFKDQNAVAWVYSVVSDTVKVFLFEGKIDTVEKFGNALPVTSFNYRFISEGFAQLCEEPYLSRENHTSRVVSNVNQEYETFTMLQKEGILADLNYQSPSAEECKEQVTLKGPFSPFESNLECMTKKSIGTPTYIETNSVNSVLIDTNPSESHKRLVVASYVTQNQYTDSLTLRSTTVMPNVHGLHALMPMIFARHVELRANETRTSYIGALCGLGYDENTGIGYYPEIDIEVSFNTEFDQADIDEINKLRFWMNYMIDIDVDSDISISSPRFAHAQKKIQESYFKILTRTKSSKTAEIYERSFEWGTIMKEHLLIPTEVNSKSVFNLIASIKLEKEVEMCERDIMLKHLEELKLTVDETYDLTDELKCHLCDFLAVDIHALRLHVRSSFHRTKVANFIMST